MRIKAAHIKCYSTKDLYKHHKERSLHPLNINDYSKAMNKLTELIVEDVVRGNAVHVPRLGTFNVRAVERMSTKKTVNWKESWEKKKNGEERWMVFQENGETYPRFMLDKNDVHYSGKWNYGWKSSRFLRKLLGKEMQEDEFCINRYSFKRNNYGV